MKNIVLILHIYGALAIFLPVCIEIYTDYESQQMEIGVAEASFTQTLSTAL